jgi:amino acid transporter
MSGEIPDESHDEQLQREHEQLFHELRAIIPGAEVLFAFMLTVAFSDRFEDVTTLQRSVYYVTLLTAGTALLLLLAPASFHRVQFRRHDKEVMMRVANTEAIVALVLVSLAIAGAVFLITDLLFTTVAAVAVAAALWVVTSLVWWGVPLSRRTDDVAADGARPNR